MSWVIMVLLSPTSLLFPRKRERAQVYHLLLVLQFSRVAFYGRRQIKRQELHYIVQRKGYILCYTVNTIYRVISDLSRTHKTKRFLKIRYIYIYFFQWKIFVEDLS